MKNSLKSLKSSGLCYHYRLNAFEQLNEEITRIKEEKEQDEEEPTEAIEEEVVEEG